MYVVMIYSEIDYIPSAVVPEYTVCRITFNLVCVCAFARAYSHVRMYNKLVK